MKTGQNMPARTSAWPFVYAVFRKKSASKLTGREYMKNRTPDENNRTKTGRRVGVPISSFSTDPIKADDAQSDRQTGLKVRSDPHGDRTHVTFELPGYGRALWKHVQLRVGMLGTTRRACLSPDA
jgi:hypothetical protein